MNTRIINFPLLHREALMGQPRDLGFEVRCLNGSETMDINLKIWMSVKILELNPRRESNTPPVP